MDPIRNKIAEIIRHNARNALVHLDPKSDVAKALKKADVEAILNEDIPRICEAISFLEMTRALALAAQLKSPDRGQIESAKQEIKKIAQAAASKAEAKGGKLIIPDCCRDVLFAL